MQLLSRYIGLYIQNSYSQFAVCFGTEREFHLGILLSPWICWGAHKRTSTCQTLIWIVVRNQPEENIRRRCTKLVVVAKPNSRQTEDIDDYFQQRPTTTHNITIGSSIFGSTAKMLHMTWYLILRHRTSVWGTEVQKKAGENIGGDNNKVISYSGAWFERCVSAVFIERNREQTT